MKRVGGPDAQIGPDVGGSRRQREMDGLSQSRAVRIIRGRKQPVPGCDADKINARLQAIDAVPAPRICFHSLPRTAAQERLRPTLIAVLQRRDCRIGYWLFA